MTPAQHRLRMARRPAPLDVLCCVSRHTGVLASRIVDGRRDAAVTAARSMYAYCLRKFIGMSYPEIATAAGMASHTSARDAVARVVEYLSVLGHPDYLSAYWAIMSEMKRDSPSGSKAILYGASGKSVIIRTLLDGSVSLTSPNDPEMSMHAASAAEALKLAGAWLNSNTETEAA